MIYKLLSLKYDLMLFTHIVTQQIDHLTASFAIALRYICVIIAI